MHQRYINRDNNKQTSLDDLMRILPYTRLTEERILDAGYYRLHVEPTPEGMQRVGLARYEYSDDTPDCTMRYDYEPMPDPMPEIIQRASASVMILSSVLAVFGLTIPVAGGYDGAVTQIGAMQLNETQLAMIGTLGVVYDAALKIAGSDEMITAVYEAITNAE
jgi:hypothetical protein